MPAGCVISIVFNSKVTDNIIPNHSEKIEVNDILLWLGYASTQLGSCA